MAGLRKEYREEHLTYAELEENDEDLIKLRNWFARIKDRDVFGAPGRQACADYLEACERAPHSATHAATLAGGPGWRWWEV